MSDKAVYLLSPSWHNWLVIEVLLMCLRENVSFVILVKLRITLFDMAIVTIQNCTDMSTVVGIVVNRHFVL